MTLIGKVMRDLVPSGVAVLSSDSLEVRDAEGRLIRTVTAEVLDADGDSLSDFLKVTVTDAEGTVTRTEYGTAKLNPRTHELDSFADNNGDGVVDWYCYSTAGRTSNGTPFGRTTTTFLDQNFDGLADRMERLDESTSTVLEDVDLDGVYDVSTRVIQSDSDPEKATTQTRRVSIDVATVE